MRIVYLAIDVHGLGGTEQAVIAQANALARRHEVEIVSVYRSRATPLIPIDPAVTVTSLVSLIPGQPIGFARPGLLSEELAQQLRSRTSILLPPSWDPNFDALADVALEEYLPRLQADVVVSVAPALTAVVSQLVDARTAVVHQEHRSPSQRVAGLAPLLVFGPRVDVVAVLTEDSAEWLTPRLGPAAPAVVVVPNALPPGYRPRSQLDQPVIVTAGRLVREKRFDLLVDAFGDIADRLPSWRLRIFGTGNARRMISETARRRQLFDRVELPGATEDMKSEWARAGIAALTSAKEGLPLVIQEAMAAGVPVVSVDCNTGPRDLIDHDINGLLVAPGSAPALASALLRLATDDQLRHRLGAGALASAAGFDSAVITHRWEEVFGQAARARKAGRPGRGRVTQRLAHLARQSPRFVDAPDTEETVWLVTPEERDAARGDLLRAVSAIAARVAGTWFALSPPESVPPESAPTVVAVPSSARDAFLRLLARSDVPAGSTLWEPALNGWPERHGAVSTLAEDLRRGRSPLLRLKPPLARGAEAGAPTGVDAPCIEVQFWDVGPDGDLHAPAPHSDISVTPSLVNRTVTIDGVDMPSLDATFRLGRTDPSTPVPPPDPRPSPS